MQIEILKQEKSEMEFKIDNSTIAEILRVYLNKQDIDFAAWRREHPTKPLILRVESSSKTVKKAISDAVAEIKKDLLKISLVLKKK